MGNINIRIDDTLKAQLQELTSELGMDITTFFTMAAKQAVRERRLPFIPDANPYNYETMKAKWEIEFMKAHPELNLKTHDSAASLFEEVLNEDDV